MRRARGQHDQRITATLRSSDFGACGCQREVTAARSRRRISGVESADLHRERGILRCLDSSGINGRKDEKDDAKATDAKRWVAAVHASGKLGVWSHVCFSAIVTRKAIDDAPHET